MSSIATGAALGSPGYRLIDADSHVNEPPDLWTSRVASKYTDLCPRMESFEQGDGWVMEGVRDPISFGFNAAAGLRFQDRRPWIRWEEVPAAGYEPKARLAEMDTDLVDASVLYPTPRISQLMIGTQDPELHLALVRAYNDWLAEFVGDHPERLGGLMIVPNRGVGDAVAEIRRMASVPGIVGGLIGCYPHGDVDLDEDDDPVWAALVEADMAAHIHVKVTNEMPEDIFVPNVKVSIDRARGDLRFLHAPVLTLQFLIGGVFNRFPDLRLVLAEVDAGWVPFVKEQIDNRFLRKSESVTVRTEELPSSVIGRHVYYTYITDSFAIRNRHSVGLERMMWSSDFPHSGSNWPNSVHVNAADFADVPGWERDLILGGNAQRLYKFSA